MNPRKKTFAAHVPLGVSAVALLLLVSTTSVRAGTIAEEYLADLTEVKVLFSASALAHDPIPGLDLELLRKEATQLIETELHRCGLKRAEAAGAILLFRLDKRRIEGIDSAALTLTVELREPAMLKRAWPEQSDHSKELQVTTWRKDSVMIAQDDQAMSRFLERVTRSTREFAQRVRSTTENYGGQVQEGAFDFCFVEPD